MKKTLKIYCGLILFLSINTFGQDVDSLLTVALNKTRQTEYNEALKIANKALKITPKYLDFHLIKGQIHYKLNNLDSAKYFFKHVIKEDDSYLEAHSFLINAYLKENDYKEALQVKNKSIEKFPQEKQFQLAKLNTLKLLKENDEVELLLTILIEKYPEDIEFKTELNKLESIYNYNRIGINYNLTLFDRKERD